MNRTPIRRLWLAALVVAGAGEAGAATLGARSRLWLEGTSTLHPFESRATALHLALSFTDPEAEKGLPAAVAAERPASLTLRVPVAELKSEHKGLDQNLRKALKVDAHPDIVFKMTSYRVEAASGTRTVAAEGALTVAGVTRSQTVRAALRSDAGRLALEGRHALLMTDFGIKPPTMMLGTIKTGDKVTIGFHLELEADGGAASDEKKKEE